jgi:hypothetical protein
MHIRKDIEHQAALLACGIMELRLGRSCLLHATASAEHEQRCLP